MLAPAMQELLKLSRICCACGEPSKMFRQPTMTEFGTHLLLLILDIILIDTYSINPDDPFPVLLAKHLQGCVQVYRHRERESIESYLLLWVLTVGAPGV